MATLVAGEKARMYALGKLARGGATRGAYRSADTFISIGGVPVHHTRLTYAEVIKAAGATHHWRLEEATGPTTADSIGTATGTLTSSGIARNQPSAIADGRASMAFDGATGGITMPPVTTPTGMTIEACLWTIQTAGAGTIFSTRGLGDVFLGVQNGILAVYTTQDAVAGTIPVNNGQWHFIAATLTGSAVTLYVDGVADGPFPLRHVGGTSTAWIGFEAGANYLLGTLDEVAIYPRPLTAAELALHFAAYRAFAPVGRVLMDTLSITDTLEQAPNTCAFTAMGIAPALGQPVVITLGSPNTLNPLFAGQVLRTEQVYLVDNPDHVAYRVDCIDHTPLLDRRLVIALYRNLTATAIALDLIARFTTGFTTAHVASGLPVLDEISFTNTSVTDALSQLAKRIGASFYVDYAKDLHFYLTAEDANSVTPPRAVTPTHPTVQHVALTRDRSQVVTRAYCEGGGGNAAGAVTAGDTIVPVDAITWYNPAGGVVTVQQQRLTYTTPVAGGAGTLVGPGVQPVAAPKADLVPGAGVTLGAHDYAVSFVTGVGESLVGPRVAVNVLGVLPPPTQPPTLLGASSVAAGGSGPDVGGHQYAVSFVTAAGETLIGPATGWTQPALAPPTSPIAIRDYPYSNTYFTSPYFRAGDTIVLWGSYSSAPNNALSAPPTINETPRGPAAAYVIKQAPNGPPGSFIDFQFDVPCSPDPNVKTLHVWISGNGGPATIFGLYYSGTGGWPNAPGQISQTFFYQTSSVGAVAAPTTFNPVPGGVTVYDLQRGGAAVTARRLYRWDGTGVFRLALVIPDNTTTTATDRLTNAQVAGQPAAPSTNTATVAQVALSGIPISQSSPSNWRRIYRSAANTSALKLLTTITDNTTTTFLDTLADASLGVNAPAGDTSGLKQPEGQALAGSTTILVAGAAAFRPTGGWALVTGQTIRYTGISGNSLTGIPASGVGAILATISYNATIIAANAIEGIPASGVGAITLPIKTGDPVNVLVQVDDAAAQAAQGAITGGDGIIEMYVQDNRLSEIESRARANALLALRKDIEATLTYTTRELNLRSGSTVHVDLPLPTNLAGDYKIQQITFSLFQYPHVYPLATVTASSNRFSFEDLLRVARNSSGIT